MSAGRFIISSITLCDSFIMSSFRYTNREFGLAMSDFQCMHNWTAFTGLFFPPMLFFLFFRCVFLFIIKNNLQVVYLTFERLWNLPRETFAPLWSLSQVFMTKILLWNHYKRSDLKILRNGDPVGLWLNMVKSGQPSSAKCAFHKSFEHTSYICLSCQLYFSLCM